MLSKVIPAEASLTHTVCVRRVCLGLHLERCVQAIHCLSEKWPCVCLSECIFFSAICMPLCLHQSQHVLCMLCIQLRPLSVSVCVLVWLGAAPAVSKWAAPNAWTPRRGRKGGVKGERARGELGGRRGSVGGMNGGNGGGQLQVQVAGEESKS